MNAPPQAVPKPPADIWAEMQAAGAAGDDLRLAVAHEHYVRWLEAEGYHVTHGTNRPDEAIR